MKKRGTILFCLLLSIRHSHSHMPGQNRNLGFLLLFFLAGLILWVLPETLSCHGPAVAAVPLAGQPSCCCCCWLASFSTNMRRLSDTALTVVVTLTLVVAFGPLLYYLVANNFFPWDGLCLLDYEIHVEDADLARLVGITEDAEKCREACRG